MGWELWLFLGVEGLDMRICWGFRGKKMRGSLHCGFASGRDDGGGGRVRKRTDNGKSKGEMRGPSTSLRSGRDDGGGGWGGEQTTARAKAKCGGPSTARFALRSV